MSRIYGLDPPRRDSERLWVAALDVSGDSPGLDQDGLPLPPARAFFCRLCQPPCAECPLNPPQEEV